MTASNAPPNTSLLDAARVAARALVLERIHYYAREGLPMGALSNLGELRLLLPMTVERLIASLTTYVYAERVQTQSYIVRMHYPADWWQMARAQVRRWALDHSSPWWMLDRWRWALQRLEVRTLVVERQVEFTHWLKWPEFVATAELDTRRAAFKVSGNPISEVRVGGSWEDAVEGGRWWEDA